MLIIKGTRGTDSEHEAREQHIALVKMGEHDRVADVVTRAEPLFHSQMREDRRSCRWEGSVAARLSGA